MQMAALEQVLLAYYGQKSRYFQKPGSVGGMPLP